MFTLLALAAGIALFLGMLALLDLGFRRGRLQTERDPGAVGQGLGSAEGAVYGLLGLLLAFSFSGAFARFQARRDQIVSEANAASTAYLRLDLVPAEQQDRLRDSFRRYVDTRLAVYRALPDLEAAKAELARSATLQKQLWSEAVAATRTPGGPGAPFLLGPLNDMFDIASTRTAAAYSHPPPAVFGLLILLALVSAHLVGRNMSVSPRRSRLHMVLYAATLSIVVYVIVDLEFPRMGLIRLSEADRFLAEVRESMR